MGAPLGIESKGLMTKCLLHFFLEPLLRITLSFLIFVFHRPTSWTLAVLAYTPGVFIQRQHFLKSKAVGFDLLSIKRPHYSIVSPCPVIIPYSFYHGSLCTGISFISFVLIKFCLCGIFQHG